MAEETWAFGPSSQVRSSAASPLFGSPGIVADDRDELLENDDLAHSGNLLRLAVVDVTYLAAKHGADGYRGELQARRHGVDAIDDLAVHLIGGVDPLERLADEGELARVLHCDISRRGQPARVVDQHGVSERATASLMGHRAVRGMARVGRHFPTPRRGFDQHGAGGCTCFAQRGPEGADGGRAAGGLNPENRIRVELVAWWSVFHLHLLPAGIELLRKDHRHGRIDSLAHLDLRHDQGSPCPGGRCG